LRRRLPVRRYSGYPDSYGGIVRGAANSHRTQAKLAALRSAVLLRRGGMIAHVTATLPGVAVAPQLSLAVSRLSHFKQRSGPFLLLADSVGRALSLARYCSPMLRRIARHNWPGPVTLVFAGKPGLPPCCYRRGKLAVRVDASLQTRQLAAACGGLLLSSSLNRKGHAPSQPGLRLKMRSHRYLAGCLGGVACSGKASTIMRIWRNDSTIIRQ